MTDTDLIPPDKLLEGRAILEDDVSDLLVEGTDSEVAGSPAGDEFYKLKVVHRKMKLCNHILDIHE